MSENSSNDGKFLFGFFLGGLLGACIIFFLGTKEGKKAGRDLEQKGKDILDEIEEKLEELEHRGKALVRKGETVKQQVIEAVEDKKEEITDSAVERIDTALAHLEELQQQGVETTATLRKRFKNIPKRR